MSKPRLFLVGPAAPYRGGIAHFSNRLSRALAGDFEVQLLTFSRQYPVWLFPGKTQTDADSWDLPSQPVRLIDSMNPFSWGRAGRWLAQQEPDVVVLSYWMPFFAPAYLGLLRALRRASGSRRPCVVLWLHNLLPHERMPFTGPLLRRLLRRCDRFVTLSGKVRQDLQRLSPDAAVLEAFHPVYDIFRPAIPPPEARRALGLPERRTLLFFGLVRRYKGLDVLLRAMPAVRAQHDVQLVVAGEFYEKEETYVRLASELGLLKEQEEAVHLFSSYVPNDRVHLYYSAADVVVQPYRAATQSGVVQTAFFFGKPVVVTAVGGLAEAVQDGSAGLVVPPEDPEALAGAILRFLDADPAPFAAAAKQQAERFSWSALAGAFRSFVDPCIVGRAEDAAADAKIEIT